MERWRRRGSGRARSARSWTRPPTVAPNTATHDEPWVAAAALAALVFGFLVSYAKARAQSLGYDCNVGIRERAERLILIIAALVFDLVPPAMVVLAALSLVTFLQRMVHVRL